MNKKVSALLIVLALPLQAVEIAGISVTPEKTVSGQTLQLNGAGLRTVFVVRIKAYVAALYTAKPLRTAEDALAAEGPLRFDFTFLRAVSASKVKEAWEAQFRESLSYSYADLARDQKKFIEGFGALKKGGVQTVVFEKDATLVYEEDVLKTTIPGRPFQLAFLSLWFGSKPVQPSLMKELLGSAK